MNLHQLEVEMNKVAVDTIEAVKDMHEKLQEGKSQATPDFTELRLSTEKVEALTARAEEMLKIHRKLRYGV